MGSKARQGQDEPSTRGDPEAAPPREVEIKFRGGKAENAAVLGSGLLKGVEVGPVRELLSTYYDTAGMDLRKAGMTLRVRRKGRAAPVLGLKWSDTPQDVFGRSEIEVSCPDGEPRAELFAPDIAERLTAATGGRALVPVFKTRIRRRTALLREAQSLLELSLDEGFAVAGEASTPLSEIEIELKSGDTADLVRLSAGLASDCGLSLSFESKSARGFRLLDGEAPQPQRAQPVELVQKARFGEAMAAVLSNTLGHFVANWAALRESDAPEAVHQLRVALRRLRSVLAIFRRTFALPEIEDLRARAREIASALAPARECDVFRQNVMSGPCGGNAASVKGAAALLDVVERRRLESYAAARAVIDDPATSRFVLDVQSFLARGGWSGPEPAGPSAAAALDRLHRRALKRGKGLADMPDAQRHELRIALKNLRYGAEFFGSLFTERKEMRGFLRRVSGLQEDLGAHNDAATAEAFLATLDLPPSGEAALAAGYVIGWHRRAILAADARLVKDWKRFRKAPVFWA